MHALGLGFGAIRRESGMALHDAPDNRHMKLTLHYRGPLRSNGTAQDKHSIRQAFHAQLKALWTQPPLTEMPTLLAWPVVETAYSVIRPRGGFVFAPLIVEQMSVVAHLAITLLRPEPPGRLITQGGDIDNRLKTLFDALSMPPQPNALPVGATPGPDESPFYCLLEDDNLITSVEIRTQQLLEPVTDRSEVELLIEVQTSITRPTMGNLAFA